MDELKETPYTCHVFVCTNDRGGTRRSCADDDSPAVRATLKQVVADRGWRGKVRVSKCGCMGLCGQGPNVMLYPQGRWLSGVTADDVPAIVELISRQMPE